MTSSIDYTRPPSGWNQTEAANSSDNTSSWSGLGGLPYPSGYSWAHIAGAAAAVTVVMAAIVIGNILVIVAIAKDPRLKAVQNWFIASLAVSDLLLGLLVMPFSLANELMGYWYFGEILCQLWLSIDVLLCTASILNLCLISLDRYWSITRAVSYVRQRTPRRAALMLALVWLLSAIICFPPLAGWKRPQPRSHGLPLCVLSEEIGYVVYSTMGSFFIPLAVMVIVYAKIYLAARERARRNLKKRKPVAENGGGVGTGSGVMILNKERGGKKQQPQDEDDGSSDLEEEAEPISEITCGVVGRDHGGGGDSTDPGMSEPGAIRMSVTNHMSGSGPEEKQQLLDEDTDTDGTTAVWQLQKQPHGVNEDTDSTMSDGNIMDQRNGRQYHQVKQQDRQACNEKLKPLLLESSSQPESDSTQKDSDNRNGGGHVPDTSNGGAQTNQAMSQSSHTDPKPPKDSSLSRKLSRFNSKDSTTSNSKNDRLLSVGNLKRFNLVAASKAKDKKDSATKTVDPERAKRKLARARERRATLVLGVIMATFIMCWLPFFLVYLLSVLIGFHVPPMVFAVMFWAGYCNSALNPLIYTIFNEDFRKAFARLVLGRRYTR